MADKIEVWAHLHSHRGEWFVDEKPHETKVAGLQKASTLVVHDGLHERVYTESEVKAMLDEMIAAKVFRVSRPLSDWAVMVRDIRSILKKNGIVLDPA